MRGVITAASFGHLSQNGTQRLMPARFWTCFRRSRALSNCLLVTCPQLYLVLIAMSLSRSSFRPALNSSGGALDSVRPLIMSDVPPSVCHSFSRSSFRFLWVIQTTKSPKWRPQMVTFLVSPPQTSDQKTQGLSLSRRRRANGAKKESVRGSRLYTSVRPVLCWCR